MSVEAIRFRADQAGVILQVLEREEGPYYDRAPKWRDAKVEDLLEVARYTRKWADADRIEVGGAASGFENLWPKQ